MPILIECPSCQRQLRVQDALLGKRVKCPGCGTAFGVQPPESSPAQPPPPPPRIPPPPSPLDAPPPVSPEQVVNYQDDDEPSDQYDEERAERRQRKKRKARRAAERLKLPAIFMLILGVLGILFLMAGTIIVAVGGGLAAAAAGEMPLDDRPPPGFPGRPGRPQPADPEFGSKVRDVLAVGVGITIVLGLVGLTMHGLMVLGSVFMMRGRSFGLSITATIMCMLSGFFACFGGGIAGNAIFAPCGCMAVIFIPLYLGIGIWALVVLMSQDVKAAFT